MSKKPTSNRPLLWKPNVGPQNEFLSRMEDIVGYGGTKGPGKTDALINEGLRQVHIPGYNGIVIRRNFPQLREIIDRMHALFPQMRPNPPVWRGGESRWRFPSGAHYEVGHCQHEESKQNYQGRELHYIGYDQLEQFFETQFRFINMQNRTSNAAIRCYIRATFNPGGVGHWWIKRTFIDGKKPGQTYKVEYRLPDGRILTRTMTFIFGTVYDNPVLLEANPTYLANLMSLPETERKAYLEGDWDAFVTDCAFDRQGMLRQESKVQPPQWIGYLRDNGERVSIIPDENGSLRIYQEPKLNENYEVGADVAEGVKDGDYSSAHVINKRTLEVVAHVRGHWSPGEFGDILALLAYYYNNAEIACEVNGPGAGTIQRLRDISYTNVYMMDETTWGWRTTVQSRAAMIATVQQSIIEGTLKVYDRDTLDEMYNFVRNEKNGKLEAREDTHDDRVMSLCIAVHCTIYAADGANKVFQPRLVPKSEPWVHPRFRNPVSAPQGGHPWNRRS